MMLRSAGRAQAVIFATCGTAAVAVIVLLHSFRCDGIGSACTRTTVSGGACVCGVCSRCESGNGAVAAPPEMVVESELATRVRDSKAGSEPIVPLSGDGLPSRLPALIRQFDPASGTANTWESAYWLMLQLRKSQEIPNNLGHIG